MSSSIPGGIDKNYQSDMRSIGNFVFGLIITPLRRDKLVDTSGHNQLIQHITAAYHKLYISGRTISSYASERVLNLMM